MNLVFLLDGYISLYQFQVIVSSQVFGFLSRGTGCGWRRGGRIGREDGAIGV